MNQIFQNKSLLKKKGLDVSFIDIENHSKKYHAISLLNVFSHLPNPPEFLLKIRNLLYRDGELLLQTGDTSTLKSNEHPKPFYLPDHLSFASEKIVANLLKNTGFQIISITKHHNVK